MNPLLSLGIAIKALFLPLLPLPLVLAFGRHGRPRMAWISLFLFGCIREISGSFSIVYSIRRTHGWYDPGMFHSARTTLDIAVIALLLSTVGLLRIVHARDFRDSIRVREWIWMVYIGLVTCFILHLTGSILRAFLPESDGAETGVPHADWRKASVALFKVAWVLILAVLLMILGLGIALARRFHGATRPSRICLVATAIATPFLMVRVNYGVLGALYPSDSTSNVLPGSVDAFVGMVLIMEWVVAALYLAAGFKMAPSRDAVAGAEHTGDDTGKLRQSMESYRSL